MTWALECPTWAARWQTEAYSSQGMTQEGAWVDQRLDQGQSDLRLFAQQGFTGSACAGTWRVELGRTGAVRYAGDLDVLRLSLSDQNWQDLVPVADMHLQGEAERWKWWFVGLPLEHASMNQQSTWSFRPKLIALTSHASKALSGQLTRDAAGIALDATYEESGTSSLGFLRSPQSLDTSPGWGVDVGWAYAWGDGSSLSFSVENLWSSVSVAGYWWSTTRYQLSDTLDGASKQSFTENNEVTGEYGQRDQVLHLPRIARVAYRPVNAWVDELALVHTAGQWHVAAEKSWRLGPGSVDVRLQDFSTALVGYTWELPWGRDHQLRWAWAWSKWGTSQPMVLSWQMNY